MHEYLAAFVRPGTEGVLFIGRAQEKNTVFRTEKRRAADGRPTRGSSDDLGGEPVLRALRG